MPKLHAPMLARSALASSALAGLVLMAVPAEAQVYYRPFGGVYVERYYEPLPPGGYYAPPPPAYYPPPRAYRGPGRFPFADVAPMLRSMGMSGIGRARVDGDTYVVDATDGSGTRVRVRIDAFNGRILALHPMGPAPVARQSVPAMPAVPPLPPTKPPELAAVTAPAVAPVTDPQGAPPPGAAPAVAAPVTPPEPPAAAAQPAPTPEEKPAVAATPPTADKPVAATPSPDASGVRVIPGIAVPPGTAPKDEAQTDPPPAPESAGAGTGTGTGTGSDTPAGTASVVARGTKPPVKPAPAED